MYRKHLDGDTFMLRRCGKRTVQGGAHAPHCRNEKLAASAKAKEHGNEKSASPQYELRTRLGCRLWGLSHNSECGRSCFVLKNVLFRENVRKSLGFPNLPTGRKGLGTCELEKMHVLNPIYPRRKLQKIIRIHGAARAKKPLENKF